MKRALDRSRRRARAAGMSPVSIVLEGAAVMAWFAVVVSGERLVQDTITARRGLEARAVAQAQRARDDCGGAAADLVPHGPPSVSSFVSTLSGLGLGSEPTFRVYRDSLDSAEVVIAEEHRGGAIRAAAARAVACQEVTFDEPAGSLSRYRKSLFDAHVRGY